MTSSWKASFELLGGISAIFAVIGGLYAFYVKVIFPRTAKAKLKKLNEMMTAWYDEIDRNLNAGLNMDVLNNHENKIHEFIRRNLKNYWLKPTPAMIRKWNKEMGYKNELLNSKDLFHRSSQLHPDGLSLDLFFTMIIANFYKFHKNYPPKKNGDCNFAEVEMPLKFFRFYVDAI